MFPWRTFVLAANNVRGEHCSRGGHLFARRTVSAANNCPYGYNGEQLFAANKFFAIICPPRTVFVRQTAVRRRTSWRTSSRRSSSEYARSPSESARSSSESGGRSANVRRTLPEFAKKKRRTMAEFARSPLVFAWSPPMFANTFSPAKLPIFGVKMP